MRSESRFYAGFSLLFVYIFLIAIGGMVSGAAFKFNADISYFIIIIFESAAFLIPSLVLKKLLNKREKIINFRLNRFNFRSMGLVLKFSFAVSFMTFLINYFFIVITKTGTSLSNYQTFSSEIQGGYGMMILALAVAPAILEEIFLRGAVFSAYEGLGTFYAILASGTAFSVLHASAPGFPGLLAAGIAYSYLTYILDSVWPSIIAHFLNNIYFLLMNWLMTSFKSFGLWPYFFIFNVFLFLIFTLGTLSSLEKMAVRKKLVRLEKTQENAPVGFINILNTPGYILFIILFIFKIFFV